MSADDHDMPLPPPAFPSGMSKGEAEADLPEEALISFDEPVVRDGPVQLPPDFERVMHQDEGANVAEEIGDVVVTGIGAEHAAAGHDEALMDPYLERVVSELEALAGALRRKGESAFRTEPEMTRFEATLRGYCVGYLAALKDTALEAEHDHDFD